MISSDRNIFVLLLLMPWHYIELWTIFFIVFNLHCKILKLKAFAFLRAGTSSSLSSSSLRSRHHLSNRSPTTARCTACNWCTQCTRFIFPQSAFAHDTSLQRRQFTMHLWAKHFSHSQFFLFQFPMCLCIYMCALHDCMAACISGVCLRHSDFPKRNRSNIRTT